MTESNNFGLIKKVQKSDGSPTVVFAARFDMGVVRYRGRNFKVDTFDVRSSKKIRDIFGRRKWNIVIEIGFFDLDDVHHAFNPANDITYGDLLSALKRVGYDPLLPLRSKSFQEQVGRVIGLKVQQANRNISKGSHHTIREKLIPYAREIRDYARDYVRGGIAPGKPALAGNTMRFRYSKEENHPEFYSYHYGINEPLWETGQLEDEIDFRVYVAEETTREKISRGDESAIAEMMRKKRISEKKNAAKRIGRQYSEEVSDGTTTHSWAGAETRGQIFKGNVTPVPVKAAIVARAITGKKKKRLLSEEEISPNLRPGEVLSFDDLDDVW